MQAQTKHSFSKNKNAGQGAEPFWKKASGKKAQGAIEYLLVIGAVIIVVAVVIIALSGTLTEANKSVDKNEVTTTNDPLKENLADSMNKYYIPQGTTQYYEYIGTNPITLQDLESVSDGLNICLGNNCENATIVNGNIITVTSGTGSGTIPKIDLNKQEPPAQEICNDLIDNDRDGKIDCLDLGCNNINSCEYQTEITCNDTIDNDKDGLEDCLDLDCENKLGCIINFTEKEKISIGMTNFSPLVRANGNPITNQTQLEEAYANEEIILYNSLQQPISITANPSTKRGTFTTYSDYDCSSFSWAGDCVDILYDQCNGVAWQPLSESDFLVIESASVGFEQYINQKYHLSLQNYYFHPDCSSPCWNNTEVTGYCGEVKDFEINVTGSSTNSVQDWQWGVYTHSLIYGNTTEVNEIGLDTTTGNIFNASNEVAYISYYHR